MQSTFLSPNTFQPCALLWVGVSGEMVLSLGNAISSLLVVRYTSDELHAEELQVWIHYWKTSLPRQKVGHVGLMKEMHLEGKA